MKDMKYAQITTSRIIAEGTHGEFESVQKRYKNAVSNAKKFNRGLITARKTKVANGEMTKFYYEGNLIQEFYILHDRTGWEFGITKFDGKGQ